MRSMYKIQLCEVEDIRNAPNIDVLLSSYASEGSIPEIGEQCPQWDTYEVMCKAGLLHILGAFQEDMLVGFVTFIVSELPHYGVNVATSESLFLHPEHRHGRLGINIIRAAQLMAKDLGAKAFMISAPHGGKLEELAPAIGFRETNRVFCRSL